MSVAPDQHVLADDLLPGMLTSAPRGLYTIISDLDWTTSSNGVDLRIMLVWDWRSGRIQHLTTYLGSRYTVKGMLP